MRLCIIETDTYADSALIDHGSIPAQFEAWLRPALPDAEFDSIAVFDGAALPALRAYDGYLVTGSRYGVYDALPWMAPLEAFLRAARDAAVPVGGICFGHQIMAHAYGGRVEKSDQGWILGAQDYAGHTAFAMHQDQVVKVPGGAREIISANRCDVARIVYDFPSLSVQYHPEFTQDFMQLLLDMYEQELDMSRVSEARESLKAPIHAAQIAQDFASFFEAHIRTLA